MEGLLGQKIGMTSVFLEKGQNIPVTIVKVIPNVVTSVITKKKNGYNALQLATFDRPDKTISKPLLHHLKKSKTTGKYFIKEIKNMTGFVLGEKIDSSIFKEGNFVDIVGISKGKGFSGTIKRYNQSIGPKSHGGGGGSKPLRLTGSLGDVSSNRVFKGQTMPGQMGNVKRTMQNLKVVFIDVINNFILIKGSIPGPKKGFVVVKSAIKGLPSKFLSKMVDFNEKNIKNELLKAKENTKKIVDSQESISDDITIKKQKDANVLEISLPNNGKNELPIKKNYSPKLEKDISNTKLNKDAKRENK